MELIEGKIEGGEKRATYWNLKLNGKSFNTKDELMFGRLMSSLGKSVVLGYDESSFTNNSGKEITMKWIKDVKFPEEIDCEEESVSEMAVPIIATERTFTEAIDFDERRSMGFSFGMAVNSAFDLTNRMEQKMGKEERTEITKHWIEANFKLIEEMRRRLLK